MTRSTFDRRIREAKAKKLENFKDDNGYIFCEECQKNSCIPVDCSHDESVDKCIKNGYPEKAYDTNNITLRGRACHEKYDGLNLQYGTSTS